MSYKQFLPDTIDNSPNLSFADCINALAYLPEKNKLKNLYALILKYINRGKLGEKKIPRWIEEEKERAIINRMVIQAPTWISLSIAAPYYRIPKLSRQVYVVSKDFFDVFKRVDLRGVQYRHLPKGICGYVELPYGVSDGTGKRDMFNGFFFLTGSAADIGNDHFRATQEKDYPVSGDVVGFAWFDPSFEALSFHWTPIPVDETISIAEGNKDINTISFDGEKVGIEDLEDILACRSMEDALVMKPEIYQTGVSTYPEHIAMMYNLLCYLGTGNPDLREFKNPIRYRSPTSETPIKKDKDLSLSKIIEVGFGFKKPDEHHVESWYSRPYVCWKRVGEGRSRLELISVKGSVKKWKDT